jgi:WD40 repeat protein
LVLFRVLSCERRPSDYGQSDPGPLIPQHGGKPLATLKGHTDFVVSAVFGLDGNRILTASDDNTARYP